MTMEMEPLNHEKVSVLRIMWLWIKGLALTLLAKMDDIARQIVKTAKDDPRRATHSLKVGLTLTIVSLFYYVQPLYESFGVSAMWAVMTVVVVFEFSVGATLSKGLNRGMATLLAGVLSLGAHHLASLTGRTYEPVVIELFVFLLAAMSTFVRFFPQVKARYDYGILIFILTFSMVSISGFRSEEILKMAQERLSTILIGAATCVIVSVLVCPVWAGGDLHLHVVQNIENLGKFMDGLANDCFRTLDMTDTLKEKSSNIGLSSILDSKTKEETLANFARWEPGHGKFMYRHPWRQYLKIGNLTRQCACRVESINAYLNSQAQGKQVFSGRYQEAFSSLSSESGTALKELAWAIQTMTRPSSPSAHITALKTVSKELKTLLKSNFSNEYDNLVQVIPIATVASLLIDTVVSVENIAEAVNELSSMANFKTESLMKDTNNNMENVNQEVIIDIPHVAITIDGATEVRKGDHQVSEQAMQGGNKI